jgi:F-type H+-transporting ATPase subunit alpha
MKNRAIISAADKLGEDQIEKIRRSLGVAEIDFKPDKSISGGFVVRVGDRIYDYTVGSFLASQEPGVVVSVGEVAATGDGIAKITGLSAVKAGEIVEFETGGRGVALNLEETEVGAAIFEGQAEIKPGTKVKTTGRILAVGVGQDLVGRVVDPFGNPLDGKGKYKVEGYNPLEKTAAGVMAREPVKVPLQTGVKIIDAVIPIGRGQRELIIGDRQTGKTAMALSAIINQKSQGVICIYVAIGQRRSSIAQMISVLEKFGAMSHTIIVAATASDSAALQYFAPYAGCAIGEYFLAKGRDALVVYDDLTRHAWAYRQISLLLRRPSGREAYPGDIFYAHSRLLERACRLNQKHGGGSITALPIIETQAGDVSAYIPTNVISITDGQVYLESDLFNAGQRPAVNVGTSVSRVGGAAQIKALKQVAGRLRLDLAQYRELAAFAQFAGELDEKTQQQLNRGEKLTMLLRQNWDEPMPVEEQVLVIWAATHGKLDGVDAKLVDNYQRELVNYVKLHAPSLTADIAKTGEIDEKIEKQMEAQVSEFSEIFHDKYQEKEVNHGLG